MCLCDVLMNDVVSVDTYQLGLWAGKQLLWNGSFQPSDHGEWAGRGWGAPRLAGLGRGKAPAASYHFLNLMGFLRSSGLWSSHL